MLALFVKDSVLEAREGFVVWELHDGIILICDECREFNLETL